MYSVYTEISTLKLELQIFFFHFAIVKKKPQIIFFYHQNFKWKQEKSFYLRKTKPSSSFQPSKKILFKTLWIMMVHFLFHFDEWNEFSFFPHIKNDVKNRVRSKKKYDLHFTRVASLIVTNGIFGYLESAEIWVFLFLWLWWFFKIL